MFISFFNTITVSGAILRKGRIPAMLLSLLLLFNTVNSQILKDSLTLNLIRKDVNNIYNSSFDSTTAYHEQIEEQYPNHPIAHILKGITIYWENYPLVPSSKIHESFVEEMQKAIELSESSKDPSLEAEYLLANLCARGMLLMFYSDNDMTSEIIPLAIGTYSQVRKSFDYTDECVDLHYFTGLYNYYREVYPDIYPVYKSLAMLFPKGSRVKGLEDLRICAKYSFILSPEASYLLSWIYLNFENDYETALKLNKKLVSDYPQNYMYRAFLIKNLLLLKRYDEAENVIQESTEDNMNQFFKGQLCVFKGLIEEKHYNKPDEAFKNYSKGVADISLSGDYGNEYLSYAYAGMSRISEKKGEKHSARIYHEKAKKLAEFKKVNFDK